MQCLRAASHSGRHALRDRLPREGAGRRLVGQVCRVLARRARCDHLPPGARSLSAALFILFWSTSQSHSLVDPPRTFGTLPNFFCSLYVCSLPSFPLSLRLCFVLSSRSPWDVWRRLLCGIFSSAGQAPRLGTCLAPRRARMRECRRGTSSVQAAQEMTVALAIFSPPHFYGRSCLFLAARIEFTSMATSRPTR